MISYILFFFFFILCCEMSEIWRVVLNEHMHWKTAAAPAPPLWSQIYWDWVSVSLMRLLQWLLLRGQSPSAEFCPRPNHSARPLTRTWLWNVPRVASCWVPALWMPSDFWFHYMCILNLLQLSFTRSLERSWKYMLSLGWREENCKPSGSGTSTL